ncbi:MAG TPA: hypothetical protein VGV93_10265 [Acidimicrobiales bacterium]|nr:hypothetical protein [Acidimicrobiales bacterium]
MNRRRFILAVGATAAAAVAVRAPPECSVPRKRYDLPYGGVVTHLGYFDTQYGDAAMLAKHLQLVGAKFARDAWPLPEASPDQRRRYLEALELAHTVAATSFVMITGRATEPIDPILDEMEPYTELLAGIEGPNEWNLKGRPRWSEELSTYVKELYAKVRDRPAFEGIPVIGPSIGLSKDFGPVFGDHSGHMDIGNFHFYQPATQVDIPYYRASLAGARTVSGNKPMVATEVNGIIGDGYPGTEEDQAASYESLMGLFGDDGIRRGFCYQLFDFSSPSRPLSHRENNLGCYRADYTAKPLAVPVDKTNRRDTSPRLLGDTTSCEASVGH